MDNNNNNSDNNLIDTKTRLEDLEKKVNELYALRKELTSTPTFNPKNKSDQFAFAGGNLYANIANTWKEVGGAKYYYGWYLSSASTGNQSITGVGFKPKLVRVMADISNAWSNGVMSQDNSGYLNGFCLNVYFDSSGSMGEIAIQSRIIYLKYTDGSDRIIARFGSFDDDGFTLNFIVADDVCNIIYECYG